MNAIHNRDHNNTFCATCCNADTWAHFNLDAGEVVIGAPRFGADAPGCVSLRACGEVGTKRGLVAREVEALRDYRHASHAYCDAFRRHGRGEVTARDLNAAYGAEQATRQTLRDMGLAG